MYKIVSAVFLIVLAAVAKGEDKHVATFSSEPYSNTSLRTEEYINFNRQQHIQNIQDYDTQMELFKQSYAASLETINMRLDLLVDSIDQTNIKLNPLEILSDLSRKCVSKYRNSIPTVATTTSIINACAATASKQLGNIINDPLVTRNYLDSYYKNNFEKDISSCKRTYPSLPLNYTTCVTKVTTGANSYTVTNQKTFAKEMEASQCTAKASIKKAFDCSFTAQRQATSSIANANMMIDMCLVGQDDCKECNKVIRCSEVYYVKQSEVSYTSSTMANPFYRRNDIKDCLLMKIY